MNLRGAGLRARAGLGIGMAAAATLLAGGAARAQVVPEAARKPFAVSVGDFIPTNKDVRTAGGTHVFSATVDYTIQQLPESTSVSQISIGYIERDQFRLIPITVSQVFRDPNIGRNNLLGIPYYYGLGLGLYNARLSAPDTTGNPKFIIGGFVQGGLDITQSLFVDVKYHYTARYDRKFLGGLQLSAGIRF